MKKDTFSNRLALAMKMNNLKQVDLVRKTKIDKTLINKYLKGVSDAKQDNLTLLADALNVNEVWLMGYDVEMKPSTETTNKNNELDEILYKKAKDLSDKDKEMIISVIDRIKKTIDDLNK